MQVDLWVWVAFLAFILVMLALDLFVFHRDAHKIGLREAAVWTGVWTAIGLAFGVLIWLRRGAESGGEYFASYVIERSLSIDNIFVFALIFGYFAVPDRYQHRVLLWGVLGALAFRGIFIAAGLGLIDAFHWTTYVFGVFLLATGIRMAVRPVQHADPGRNPILRAMRRVLPVTSDYREHRMFVRDAGRLAATPLFAALLVVETSDILFAVDSIPAVFAITRDPFIVFSSNAFAILGLRAMYFLVSGMIDRFEYLPLGLATVLALVGVKMLTADLFEVPVWASLVVIAAVIGGAVGASLLKSSSEARRESAPRARVTARRLEARSPKMSRRHRRDTWGDDPEEIQADATIEEWVAAEPDQARRWHERTAWVPLKAIARFIGRSGKRIGVTILGFALIVAGLALLVLPGPGWLVIFAGLAVLSTEYVWARRLLQTARRKATEAKDSVLRRRAERADKKNQRRGGRPTAEG